MESAISILRPSSGDVFLVPIHFHVHGVDQADCSDDGYLRWPWPMVELWIYDRRHDVDGV
jgi:hypothetical protein